MIKLEIGKQYKVIKDKRPYYITQNDIVELIRMSNVCTFKNLNIGKLFAISTTRGYAYFEQYLVEIGSTDESVFKKPESLKTPHTGFIGSDKLPIDLDYDDYECWPPKIGA